MNDSPSGSRRRFLLGLVVVLVVNLLVRVGPLLSVTHVSPDAVEYVDVARNWVEHGAPLLSVKAYYHVATDVVHYGGWVRPLLFPALMSIAGRPSLETGAWLSTGAALLLVILVACCFARIHGRRAGLVAALVVGLAPPVLDVSCFALADAAATAAVVAALLAVVPRTRTTGQDSPARSAGAAVTPDTVAALAAGLLLGVAAAFRPVNVMYALPLIGYLGWRRRGAAWRIRAACLVAFGPVLFVLAQGALNCAHHVPFFTFPQSFLFRVESFSDVMRQFDPGTIAPSAVDFVLEHPMYVMTRTARHAASYAATLLLGPRFLLFWLPAVALLAVRAWRRRLSAGAGLALAAALTGFSVHALVWSTLDPRRFLLVPLVLLTGLAVGQVFGRAESGRRPPGWAIVLLVGCLVHHGVWAGLRMEQARHARAAGRRYLSWAAQQAWNDPAGPELAAWLLTALPAGNPAVATASPWWLHLVTGRPTALWPAGITTPEQLDAYVRACPVDAVLVDRERDPPPAPVFDPRRWQAHSRGRFTLFIRRAHP